MLCLVEKIGEELITMIPSTVSIEVNTFVLTFKLSSFQHKPKYPQEFSKYLKAVLGL